MVNLNHRQSGGMYTDEAIPAFQSHTSTVVTAIHPWPTTSSETGEAVLQLDVPDSITTWVTEAVGLSEETGLGLAERTELRTFKPFFVDFTLPYSLIRGEQTKVPLTVYNYLPTCSEVHVKVSVPKGTKFIGHPGKLHLTRKKCVGPGEAIPTSIVLSFSELGSANISDGILSGKMGNYADERRIPTGSDYVRRTVLVEAKWGTPWSASPHQGCCPGMSFAVFGSVGEEAWYRLTAFVLKSFAQSRGFIFIDPEELRVAKSWLIKHLREDGSFPAMGRILNKDLQVGLCLEGWRDPWQDISYGLCGSSSVGDRDNNREVWPIPPGQFLYGRITAFPKVVKMDVLAEEKVAVAKAKNFLESNTYSADDPYTTALSAYALSLLRSPYALLALRRLNHMAITRDGLTHWSLTASTVTDEDTFMGFSSGLSQSGAYWKIVWEDWCYWTDTCVALHALSEYAILSYVGGVNLTISLASTNLDFQEAFELNRDNKKLLQRAKASQCNNVLGCLEEERIERCTCYRDCGYDGEPICGSDGQLYQNQCQMEVSSCRNGTRIKQVPLFQCSQSKYSNLNLLIVP
ncbi:hypothetical protein XENOCAPTIV_025056 [Xenoophorus captivus]|uniref:Kazal-like domain-containing protein n=1 Tax=Xenoophorus captivus TaxID=1517983 RepID=A0ABV0SB38_9TELE